MSPCTDNRSFNYSYEPSFRKVKRNVTLSEALHLAVKGDIEIMSVFNQSPSSLQSVINDICLKSVGREFRQLTLKEQKELFSMLQIALDNTGATSNSEKGKEDKNTAHYHKKWWQFWK